MSDSERFWKEVSKKKGLEKKQIPTSERFWSAKSMDLLMPGDAITVGSDLETLQKAYLSLEALRTHVHIIGATMTGKTYFMEALLRDLILRGFGACLIDPHGYLYQNIINFLGYFPEIAERVVLFNPAENSRFYVGFNPLKRSSYFGDMTVQVRFLTEGIAKVWEEDSKKTPLLRRNAGNMLYPLIQGDLTFLESQYFVDFLQEGPRKKIVAYTDRQRVLNEWAAFEKYSLPRKKDELGSLQNRIPDFVETEAVKLTIGRTQNVLDFKDIFENQKILLCNLSQKQNRLAKDDSFLLGVLLISEMVNYTKSREEEVGKQKPFFLFIDEFQRFLTPDIGETLDECRKFGLHLVMAHQHLAQLEKEDPVLYNSVKTNARTKVIFSGSWDDLEILERDVFADEHNLQEIKDEIYRTAVLNYREETRLVRGHGETKGDFQASGLSSLSGSTEIAGLGPFDPAGTRYTHSTTSVSTGGSSKGSIDQDTEVPILIPVLGKELSSREFYNLEEQRYKKTVELKKQPTQHAVIKVMENPTQSVMIKTVKPFPEDKIRQEKTENISYKNQSQYYLTPQVIKDLIKTRQDIIEAPEEKEPEYPTKFKE
jgi:hypothetical protein